MTSFFQLAPTAARFEMPVQWAPMRSAQALAAQTRTRIIHFERGDFDGDDFLPAPHVIEACCRALRDGKVRYAPGAGLTELREAIAADNTARGLPTRASEVLVTFGAKHALTMSLFTLLQPGSRVIVPNPGYPPTEVWIKYLGAEVVHAPLVAPSFSFDLDELDRLLPSASLLILNSPQRPTGMLHHEVAEVAELCARHNVPIISDEIFSRIVYPPQAHQSISTIENARERTLVIDTFSKSWQMTGFRIGWCIGPEPIVKAMDIYQQNSVTNVPVFVQEAALAALTGPQDHVHEVVSGLQARRDRAVAAIQRIPGLDCVIPEATFYVMLDIRGLGMTSEQFATELLERYHVAVVPGTAFGSVGEGFARMTFAVPDAVLDEGLAILARAATEMADRAGVVTGGARNTNDNEGGTTVSDSPLDTTSCPRRRDGVRVRRVGGRVVLILQSGGVELNETAESVWTLCSGAVSVDEIVSHIADEYDAEVDQVRADVVELVEELAGLDALDVVAQA